ncbi:MAG TPA: hypothetical protein VGC46_09955 [Allosphingosinicella sp.]
MERAEASGFGIALVGHIALIVALKFLLDTSHSLTPPPAMEVSFAEDVGLVSTAPSTEAPAPSASDEVGPVEEASGSEAAVPEPLPEPEPEVTRAPSPSTPRDRPEEPLRTRRSNVPSQPRQQPQRQQVQPRPAPQGQGQRQRSAGFDANRLRQSLGPGPSTSQGQSQQPSAAVASPQAQASFVAALTRQIARCTRQQRPPAIEARSLRPVVVIRLGEDGTLEGATVRRIEGVNDSNRQYEQQARDAILRAVRACAPYTGLPAELYAVPNGWRQPPAFRLNFPQ